MRVLVTDGDNRAALAVTRALGRSGHEVIVGERRTPALAQTSRYCASRIVYSDPATASDQFVDDLAKVVLDSKVEALVPVSDITTMLVTGHRDRLPGSCMIPFAEGATVERAANKVELIRTAMRLGVPVPRSVVVENAHTVPEDDLGFPVVIKPWKSRIRTGPGWTSTAVSYAADRSALMEDLRSRQSHHFPVLLQERIHGAGTAVFACYRDGKAVALFAHRRLRERPPWGGVSVLCESVPLSPTARDGAIRLLDHLKWHGVAMVEFKTDERDGLPKLMEINGRFWGSIQLAIDAGVDFPGLLLQGVGSTNELANQKPYRIGLKSRWLWGDFDSLLLTLRGLPGAPGDQKPRRIASALEFLKLWGSDLCYDNPKRDDPRPFLFESMTRVRQVLHADG